MATRCRLVLEEAAGNPGQSRLPVASAASWLLAPRAFALNASGPGGPGAPPPLWRLRPSIPTGAPPHRRLCTLGLPHTWSQPWADPKGSSPAPFPADPRGCGPSCRSHGARASGRQGRACEHRLSLGTDGPGPPPVCICADWFPGSTGDADPLQKPWETTCTFSPLTLIFDPFILNCPIIDCLYVLNPLL